MDSSAIKDMIDKQAEAIAPLQRYLEFLRREYRDALSREWIAANNVKCDDVQSCDDPECPYFGHILSYGKWLRDSACSKPWAEWNGRIYSTEDLAAGSWGQGGGIGLLEHVPS